jgi:hypothetical protein
VLGALAPVLDALDSCPGRDQHERLDRSEGEFRRH